MNFRTDLKRILGKATPETLWESEARLRTLGDNLPNGVIFQLVQEPDGRIHLTHISAGIEQMTGVPASEAMQDFSLLTDLILEEDRQRVRAAWRESLRSLSVFDLECRFSTRRGEVKWACFRVAPRRLPNDGTLWDGVQVDVTDTRQDLESLLQTVGAIIWEGEEDLAARTFRFSFVSQQAVVLLGYPVKDWLEQPNFWSDHLHPEDRRKVLALRRQAIAAKRDFDLEYRMMANNGRTVRLRGIVKVVAENDRRLKLRGIMVDITESKRAEAELRESEELFRTLAETTSAAIYIIRGNRCVYANPTAEARSGYTRDELLAMDVWDLVHPEVRERAHERFRTHLKEGLIPLHYETKGLSKSGQERWVEVSATPITFQGQPSLLVTTFDVTGRKRTEAALRQSQRRYTLATSAGRVGLWDWNLETNDIYVDPELKALLGYRDDEVRNHMDDWGGHIHPEDREAVMAAAADHVENRSSSYEIEHRMLRRDGAVCWFIARGTLVSGEDGIRHIVGTKTDITARKQAEEALQQTEELNRAVLASLQHHIAVLDRDGQIIAVNEIWKRFAAENGSPSSACVGPGVNYLEICRKAVRESFPPARRTLDGIVSVMNGFSDGYFEEYPCPFPSGVRWFLLSVVPLRRPEGGVVVSHMDISERKHAEEALRRSEEALRDSHTRIKDLAGRLIIAQEEERRHIARDLHDDLNQQVAALAIGISRLKRLLLDTGRATADQALNEQIARLEEKTNWLSDRIRRISHELHSSILQHIGLTAALKAYCAEFTEREGVAVSLDIQNGLEPIPPDVSLCLYRVAQESLRNIAKHSGAPSAEVKLADGRGTLELCIADRGAGFDPKQPGTRSGLGLVSIEERVKMLRGSFQLKTQPGAGTELRVQIPFRSES